MKAGGAKRNTVVSGYFFYDGPATHPDGTRALGVTIPDRASPNAYGREHEVRICVSDVCPALADPRPRREIPKYTIVALVLRPGRSIIGRFDG